MRTGCGMNADLQNWIPRLVRIFVRALVDVRVLAVYYNSVMHSQNIVGVLKRNSWYQIIILMEFIASLDVMFAP